VARINSWCSIAQPPRTDLTHYAAAGALLTLLRPAAQQSACKARAPGTPDRCEKSRQVGVNIDQFSGSMRDCHSTATGMRQTRVSSVPERSASTAICNALRAQPITRLTVKLHCPRAAPCQTDNQRQQVDDQQDSRVGMTLCRSLAAQKLGGTSPQKNIGHRLYPTATPVRIACVRGFQHKHTHMFVS
jgi:hypothetical protein